MNKKILLFLIVAILVLGIIGCTKRNDINDNKKVLKLEFFPNKSVSLKLEDDSLVKSKSINLNHKTLTERNESLYNNEKDLDVLVKYIKDTLNIEINNRWKVMVHYYNTDKTAGFVEFVYTIGEINTNRSIIFNINENKYDMIYSSCLTENIDETDLTNRINIFKNKYIQGKRDLAADETFYQEQTNFVYYINTDMLVYSYTYFFKYSFGAINNEWGTIRIIDENGDAVVAK